MDLVQLSREPGPDLDERDHVVLRLVREGMTDPVGRRVVEAVGLGG